MGTKRSPVVQTGATPIACTLTPTDLGARLADWRALRDEALVEESRDGLVWTTLWRRSDDVRERLEALIEGEKECCAFLTFEVDELDDAIRVQTRFPPSAEGLLEAMTAAVAA